MQEEFNNYEEPRQEEPVSNEAYDYQNPYTATSQPITEKEKSNLIAGLVGAFLGSLIGAVLWFIIYQIGFIAGIAGAVTAVCAMKGYELLGKCLDKKGVICSAVIVVIMVFLSNKICWTWEIYNAFTEYGYDVSIFDVFASSEEIVSDLKLMGDYAKDLIVGYLLTVLACYKDIMNAFRTAK